MIIVASQRSGAVALADHLMNTHENDHVHLIELEGFMADDLHGALKEVHAISKATKCNQYLFSVSLNPPEDIVVSDDVFREAADRVAEKLGLNNQPRVMVVHEKQGRRHAHVVFSRIDPNEMKAITLPHYKLKMRDIARDLHLDHGWDLPDGLKTYGQGNPMNFTLDQWQQAQRQGSDPREIKQLFREAWERSDTLNAFKHALEDQGMYLAKGDRRGFVALDIQANVFAVSRWAGVKAKEVKAKLGDLSNLPSMSEAQSQLRSKMTSQVKSYIAGIKSRHDDEMRPLKDERRTLVLAQREERQMLKHKQQERWIEETQARSEKLNKGLRGLFDKLTGTAKATRHQNEKEAVTCAKRDQDQWDQLILAQMAEGKELQHRVKQVKSKHRQERKLLARNIASYIARPRVDQGQEQARVRSRDRNPSLSR